MANQDTQDNTQKESDVKHIKKIIGQPTDQPATTTANGESKPDIRSAPSMGGGCIPVGSR